MENRLFEFGLNDLYKEVKSSSGQGEKFGAPAFSSLLELDEKYQVIEEIGKGGMKTVYRVYDNFARRQIAMATLAKGTSRELFDAFFYEAWLTSQLDHPNIIKIHDVGINEEQYPYFTMDLKTGSTLAEIVKSRKYSREELIEIFLKVCDAVAYAHSQNIIHLDIKPDNIQIGEFGEVLVCDWGLGRYISENFKSTEISEMDQELLCSELFYRHKASQNYSVGTPGFMAPEQFGGKEENNSLSDVYGLGGLLYYILSSKSPVSGSLDEITDKTIAGDIIPLHKMTHSIPRSLDAVAMKALRVKPSERYQSVEALRDDINRYLKGFAPKSEHISFLKRGNLFLKRNYKVSVVIMVSMMAILFVSTFSLLALEKSRREEKIAKEEASENLAMSLESMKQLKRTLKLYEVEKAAYIDLMDKYEKVFYDPKLFWEYEKFFDNPVTEIKRDLSRFEAIQSRKKLSLTASVEKAELLIISQKYKQAADLIKTVNDSELKFFYRMIQTLKLADYELISLEKFHEIIDYLQLKQQRSRFKGILFSKMVAYDHFLRPEMTDYSKVLEKVLIYYNPYWKNRVYNYDNETKVLTLSGDALEFLSLDVNHDLRSFLRFVPATTYILSGSDFNEGHRLQGTPLLRHLDISNTPMKKLESIALMTKLETLTVHKGQFSTEELSKLPRHVKVITVHKKK